MIIQMPKIPSCLKQSVICNPSNEILRIASLYWVRGNALHISCSHFGNTSIGKNVPDNIICLTLVKELGQPIISTSVKNEEGEILCDPGEIEKRFKHHVDLVIDGGILSPEPSTVISLLDDRVEIIRAGKGDVKDFLL